MKNKSNFQSLIHFATFTLKSYLLIAFSMLNFFFTQNSLCVIALNHLTSSNELQCQEVSANDSVRTANIYPRIYPLTTLLTNTNCFHQIEMAVASLSAIH